LKIYTFFIHILTKYGTHVPRRWQDWCESKLRSGNLQLLKMKKWKNQGIFMVLIVGYILISSILTWQRVQSHQDIIKLNPLITSIFQFSIENKFSSPKNTPFLSKTEQTVLGSESDLFEQNTFHYDCISGRSRGVTWKSRGCYRQYIKGWMPWKLADRNNPRIVSLI